MTIVDEQGRLFGRLNLLDAILALGILGLIPLGYGSYVLFRTPPPRITAVDPAMLTSARVVRIAIRGENFRPYMRVSLGPYQAFSFLFGGTDEAEVELRDVPSGVYDVVLYDYERERARLPKAVTIAPSPVPEVRMIAVGMLGGLKADQASQLKSGLAISGVGEVVHVGRPVPQAARVFTGARLVEVQDPTTLRVPVAISMGCYLRSREGRPECSIGEITLQASAMLMLPTPLGTFPLQIDQLRGSQPLEEVRVTVRFANAPGVATQIKEGDVDVGKVMNELAAGGRVVAVSTPRSDGATVREATLVLEAQRDTGGWVYASEPLRVGSSFLLRTSLYELTGQVIALTPGPAR